MNSNSIAKGSKLYTKKPKIPVSEEEKKEKDKMAKIKRALNSCSDGKYVGGIVTNTNFSALTKTLLMENPDYRDIYNNNIPQILLINGYFDIDFLYELFQNGHDINNVNVNNRGLLSSIHKSGDVIFKLSWLLEQGCKNMICNLDKKGQMVNNKVDNTEYILDIMLNPLLIFVKHCNQYQEYLDTGDIEVSDNDIQIKYPTMSNKYRRQKGLTKEDVKTQEA